MAERKKDKDAVEAPERQVYRYLGPADQLAVQRPLEETDGAELFDYFRPGQDVALDKTQLRWLLQRGHHFEGQSTAVAGTPLPIGDQLFTQPAASPPPIPVIPTIEQQDGSQALLAGAEVVQQHVQPMPEQPSQPFAVGTREGPSGLLTDADAEEKEPRSKRKD